MPEVTVVDTIEQDALVIALAGDLDLLTAPACEDRLLKALANRRHDCESVVLDMRQVDFCGSTGLRVLIDFARDCAGEGLPVCVIAAERSLVRRTLELTAMHRVLPVFPRLDAAFAHVG